MIAGARPDLTTTTTTTQHHGHDSHDSHDSDLLPTCPATLSGSRAPSRAGRLPHARWNVRVLDGLMTIPRYAKVEAPSARALTTPTLSAALKMAFLTIHDKKTTRDKPPHQSMDNPNCSPLVTPPFDPRSNEPVGEKSRDGTTIRHRWSC